MTINLDRWCAYCGQKLIMKTKHLKAYYDVTTGRKVEPAPNHYWKCPNKRWFFDSHSQLSDDPSSYDYYY